MAKSRVLKELANNTISLEIALNRLLIIASDIGNAELSDWAEHELKGYENERVPDYRIAKNTLITYNGNNGIYKISNAPLPLKQLYDSEDPELFYVSITDSIGTIEKYNIGPKQGKMIRDLTMFAGYVLNKTGIACTSISQIIPDNVFENIVNTVKTTLIKIFIELDKTYGCLDDLDVDIVTVDEKTIDNTNEKINKYIYIDQSVKIGDGNKISESEIK